MRHGVGPSSQQPQENYSGRDQSGNCSFPKDTGRNFLTQKLEAIEKHIKGEGASETSFDNNNAHVVRNNMMSSLGLQPVAQLVLQLVLDNSSVIPGIWESWKTGIGVVINVVVVVIVVVVDVTVLI